ncbi:MAG: hypothetical protein KF882_08415 [Bacteroidia bacterium]|nr:hypothetical protein [Bacteroidia bacterium]MCO5253539.1 hypothetical protein [Bacteroidota bacterium]
MKIILVLTSIFISFLLGFSFRNHHFNKLSASNSAKMQISNVDTSRFENVLEMYEDIFSENLRITDIYIDSLFCYPNMRDSEDITSDPYMTLEDYFYNNCIIALKMVNIDNTKDIFSINKNGFCTLIIEKNKEKLRKITYLNSGIETIVNIGELDEISVHNTINGDTVGNALWIDKNSKLTRLYQNNLDSFSINYVKVNTTFDTVKNNSPFVEVNTTTIVTNPIKYGFDYFFDNNNNTVRKRTHFNGDSISTIQR